MKVSLKVISAFTIAVALACAQSGAPGAPAPANRPVASQTPENGVPASAAPGNTAQLPPARKAGADGKPVAGKPEINASANQAPYLIGPLDVLIIKVWGQANLTGPVDVGPDGTLSMPLIGDVRADGLTREELKDSIAKRLEEFLNSPEVDVQVAKINSKRFFVYGGVGKQGEFALIRATTVMDALSLVGGFRDFANTKKIRIQRKLPSGAMTEFKFNYKDVSKGKNMEQNILLQNGDRIFVPE